MLAPITKWAFHVPTVFCQICCLLVLITFNSGSYAASAPEQDQLSLILQQLETIERLATRAKTVSTAEPNDRYCFDYLRLSQDIQRIRQGVQGYLSPSRAQPRDPAELVGDYRLDTPPEELSP
ncbi:RAQPRD family integrative conjugative element protein [Pseudomonas sp. D1-36]|uniref:integrative conjugative element protein, RAQPRD family n=1 Tax=Pseudomonas sp. D1-36 TaxID=2817387 RepID=UPI003DA8EEAE